ncbi:uncharacterized protein LOC124386403 [Silurus meridionalis]|uniref:Ig-like domain-containing protein n=1 Tax=Silurus meridionalis TaxID=175797 RepID=A0A8T0BNP3_SILME|nr:uncharacterized protein LOC124386403 [Silurus meridionalis]KAF7706990.1 hypothetical protein HF521_018208 [Silurus meridionalis]
MTVFWILIGVFSTMNTVEPGKRWVSAQSLTESPVYQPDKELSVDIGDSATLRCCFSKNKVETIDWFKQPKRQKPQIIVTVYKTSGETFYNESQKFNFRIEKSSTCIHLIILNTIQSDEAMYYCALMGINPVFADGTYLKISGTSESALCDTSATLLENSTYTNTQEITVFGLGSAMGLCALLIFCLTYFLLRRRKCDRRKVCIEDSPQTRQESEAETLSYAALKFSKRKAEVEKKKADSAQQCVYSEVKTTVRGNINNL